jgi:AraC family transcriptional activator of tynA and feaB
MSEQIEASVQALRQLVSDAYYPVTMSGAAGEGPVQVRYVTRGGGWLKSTRGKVEHVAPIRGSRSWREIEQDGRDEFMLVAPRSGEIIHRQFGRTTRIGPGQMVLIAAGAPYEFERLETGEITAHHLPGSIVREILPKPEDLCAVAFASNRGVGDAIRSLCASAWREMAHLDDAERFLIVGNIVTLLSAACRGKGKRGARAGRPVAALPPFARAIEYIEASVDDPDLGPGKIADAVGVSLSHLHALMKKHGTTAGRMVMQTRLDRCARDLRALSPEDARVSDIAFRWGFNDAAHFSRRFRSRFGCSATAYRSQSDSLDRR